MTTRRFGDPGFAFSKLPPHHKPPKLTPAQRDEIRRRVTAGEAVAALAAEFKVSVRTIRQNS